MNTKKHYRLSLNQFCEWMGKTPDELVALARESKKASEDPRETLFMEGKVRQYLQYLKGKGLSDGSRRIKYAAIKSFFEINLVPLSMGRGDRPNGESSGSNIPTREDVRRMLNVAKSRQYRAALLLAKDTGLRISDLLKLTWNYRDMGEGYWCWDKVTTQKEGVVATVFIGPETTEFLKTLPREGERILPIAYQTLANALCGIIKEAGLAGISPHGLRKFYSVGLEAGRVPDSWRGRMMGKKIGPYDEVRVERLFAAYKSAYDNLRVLGDGGAEVEELKRSIEELREENRKLRENFNRMVELDRVGGDVIEKLLEEHPEIHEFAEKVLKLIDLDTMREYIKVREKARGEGEGIG